MALAVALPVTLSVAESVVVAVSVAVAVSLMVANSVALGELGTEGAEMWTGFEVVAVEAAMSFCLAADSAADMTWALT